ncbi:DLW-39 family protein [Ornithinimicrobium cryptoxanthini]|uniref:DLW-39 family protein n=1 Tax=Ornithinimicrobium cryptoxanthini TaxID=2934161 RepID=A0ABY4YIN6_9MICO|nr:DLW-39 family protein [Ornithinimicrobium cryptoxanthini]USQ76365.1 DLW-39 family protein [Ornithinimicrobium cryptoxanthini]
MKRLMAFAALAAGALALVKKLQDEQAERDLWAEATDGVSETPPSS